MLYYARVEHQIINYLIQTTVHTNHALTEIVIDLRDVKRQWAIGRNRLRNLMRANLSVLSLFGINMTRLANNRPIWSYNGIYPIKALLTTKDRHVLL